MPNILPVTKSMAVQSMRHDTSKVEFFNDNELYQIFEYIQLKITKDPWKSDYHKRYLFLFKTLLRTGARIDEALALRPADFNLSINTVSLVTLKKKKPTTRVIPLHPELKDAVMGYFLDNHIDTKSQDLLFPMKRQAVDLYMKKMQKDLGMRIHAHKFRHTFAVKAILSGTPLNVLQQWLGHSSIFTTSIYLDITGMDTSDFMKRMS